MQGLLCGYRRAERAAKEELAALQQSSAAFRRDSHAKLSQQTAAVAKVRNDLGCQQRCVARDHFSFFVYLYHFPSLPRPDDRGVCTLETPRRYVDVTT